MDIELARANMLNNHIRSRNVTSKSVLNALKDIQREKFVPDKYQGLAFADINIPLDATTESYLMSPSFTGLLLQALNISKQDKVLEIGSGVGYLTALLSKLAKEVLSYGQDKNLFSTAKANLDSIGVKNVLLQVGDALRVNFDDKKFDVIVFTSSYRLFPEKFIDYLNMNGRIFIVLGTLPIMKATIIKKISDRKFDTEQLFETVLPFAQKEAVVKKFIF